MGEDNPKKPEPEGTGAKGLTEVIGDARAEGVGQRGEEEVERADEFEQFMISDLRLTINDLSPITLVE